MPSRLDKVPTKSFESINEKRDKNPKGIKDREPLEMFTPIPISWIISKTNIRSEYKEEYIKELAESFKTYGQLQPIQVYEEEKGEYVIIFGHCRYRATKEAGINEIKCIIVDKPSDIEIIYKQAIENEQSERLSAIDREAYIKKLRDNGESYEDISTKIGKTVQWIRQCEHAANIRERIPIGFNQAANSLGTADINNFRNASDEDAEEALRLICENPENKKDILENLNKRTIKKHNVGGKRKKKIKNNSGVVSDTPDNQGVDNSSIKFKIIRNENEKSISITKEHSADLTDSQVKSVLDLLYQLYEEKGYNQQK